MFVFFNGVTNKHLATFKNSIVCSNLIDLLSEDPDVRMFTTYVHTQYHTNCFDVFGDNTRNDEVHSFLRSITDQTFSDSLWGIHELEFSAYDRNHIIQYQCGEGIQPDGTLTGCLQYLADADDAFSLGTFVRKIAIAKPYGGKDGMGKVYRRATHEEVQEFPSYKIITL